MPHTVKQVKDLTLNEMREYSNAGELADPDAINDYLISMVYFINLCQLRIATENKCLYGDHEIAHEMPENLLSDDRWETYTHDAGDVSYSATGAKAYSFQVDRNATIYIEEETSTGVWTLLNTIPHIPVAGDGYKTYKGIITASDTTNSVRLRFSGDYWYHYRYVALFDESFPGASDVPEYTPFVPYTMPDNYFELDRIERTYDVGQRELYASHKIQKSGPTTYIFLKWDDSGEFIIHYYAKPTVIAAPTFDDLTTQDDTVLDLPDEYIPALVGMIASKCLVDENGYMSEVKNIDAKESLNILDSEKRPDSSGTGLIDKTGGW
jgi:hypothetical protein